MTCVVPKARVTKNQGSSSILDRNSGGLGNLGFKKSDFIIYSHSGKMFFLYDCLWNSLGKCLNKVFVSSGGSRPSHKVGGPGRPDPEKGGGGVRVWGWGGGSKKISFGPSGLSLF